MSTPSWAPSVSDVAAHIAQRVLTADGTTQGTFSSQTIPTDTQVTSLIDTACQDVIATCGTIPDGSSSAAPVNLTDGARTVAALGAAALVELGFFANGAETDAYKELKQRYDDGLTRLANAVAQVTSTGTINPPNETAGVVYTFGDEDPTWDEYVSWVARQ